MPGYLVCPSVRVDTIAVRLGRCAAGGGGVRLTASAKVVLAAARHHNALPLAKARHARPTVLAWPPPPIGIRVRAHSKLDPVAEAAVRTLETVKAVARSNVTNAMATVLVGDHEVH